MPAARLSRVLFVLLLALISAVPVAAQQATPVTEQAPIPIATGLTNPRGFTWGTDGTLFVALAGSGGPNVSTDDAPTNQAVGPWSGGPTAAIARIGDDGCPTAVTTGLPSTMAAMGDVLGADDVAILGDELFAAVDGGGAAHGNADQPSGIYRLFADGTTGLAADLSAWVRDNPVAEIPGDFDPDAAGYSMVADEAAGYLWVVDPNSGQVLSVTPDGTVTRIADLSAGHPVPTRVVLDPEGGVYVGTLTAVPFTDGAAKVMHIDADGTVTDAWTGLTAVTDVAVGQDGSLYALELSTGNTEEAPLVPATGRIVHQTGPDSLEVGVDQLTFPVAMEIGPDGAFYVATPAIGANGGEGMIVRLGGNDATPVAPVGECAPIPETLGAAPVATPVAEEAAPENVAVEIVDFAFSPQTLEIAAGTTVTFTNNDTSPHTATADDDSFDTAAIDPGFSASVTFDTPDTYTYFCRYHEKMTGTIVVT
jgi:plastocyanin